MHVTVRKIHISSEPEHHCAYFLRVDWKGRDLGSGFQLLLTDGRDAWRGEVSEAAVRGEAEELEMQEERYVQDLRRALTDTGASGDEYTFTLTPAQPGRRSAALTLAYEKVQKDISFRLGSVLLSAVPEPVEAVRELLIHGLERGDTLERCNQKLQQENQRLRQEQQHITAELTRYAGGKEALETELYSRFIVVLNEKKAKIRGLQQTITELEEARSSEEQKKKGSKGASRAPSNDEQEEEEEEDEYGGSTDDEEQEGGRASSPSLLPLPASMSSARESRSQSPLVDITDVAPSRKRRFRHLQPPDAVANRPATDTTQRHRRDSPLVAGTAANQKQAPQRSADAATASPDAEDLFEDF